MFGLALPERCVHCDAPAHQGASDADGLHRYLCAICIRVMESESPVDEVDMQDALRRTASDLDVAHCVALHRFNPDGPIRSVIHSAKYSGMMGLARVLGRRLGQEASLRKIDFVIPVPLHRTRLAERGYNQSALLAEGIAKDRVLKSVVRRTRPTPTQTSFAIEERIQNVCGAFAATRHAGIIRGKDVVIVDDVMTTGATIASVARTMIEFDPRSLSVAVAACVIDSPGFDPV